VATASTSVPAPVASDDASVQLTAVTLPHTRKPGFPAKAHN
jgi:hypothetical protein